MPANDQIPVAQPFAFGGKGKAEQQPHPQQQQATETNATAGSMTSDQIKELIAGMMAPITEMVKMMQGTQSSSSANDPSEEATYKKDKDHDSRLNEKSYKRMEKFTSGESEWDEWKYDFLIITRSVNPEVGAALAKIIDERKSESALTMKAAMDSNRYAGEFTSNP